MCNAFKKEIISERYIDYILVMLFFKYISDAFKEQKEEYMKKYNNDEKVVNTVIKKDYLFISKELLFEHIYENRNNSIIKNKQNVSLGQIINTTLKHIEEENIQKLNGAFRSIDFDSERIATDIEKRNRILKKLIEDFNKIDLSPSKLNSKEIIRNAFEYLIERFALNSDKNGVEFYTPYEVSTLIAKIVKPVEGDKIYDPTCGSGLLLLKAFNEVKNGKTALYGQEKDKLVYAVCKMNMFLHNIDDATIEQGDTLANPKILENNALKKFDTIVANPPLALWGWEKGFLNFAEEKMAANLDKYNRFTMGVPPKSKGEYAFILHMISSLNEEGKMAVILPHGVLFREAIEGEIRKKIIELNLLDAVIGLPPNLLYGTRIPTCVLIIKRNRKKENILFIDASEEGNYEKGKQRNKLREEDIQKIVTTYRDFKTVDKYAYVATQDEVKRNDYNLNIPRYVDTFKEEIICLDEVKNNIKLIRKEILEAEKEIDKYIQELCL